MDLLVLAIGFVIIIAIGVISARRSDSAEGYFLAGRSLPGWVVGFSVMATIVSSMTFLSNPAFTYEHDWRHMPANCTYLLAAIVALLLFVSVLPEAAGEFHLRVPRAPLWHLGPLVRRRLLRAAEDGEDGHRAIHHVARPADYRRPIPYLWKS